MAKTWGPIPPVNYLHLRGKVLRRWCWRKGNLGNWNFRTLNNLTNVRKDKTFFLWLLFSIQALVDKVLHHSLGRHGRSLGCLHAPSMAASLCAAEAQIMSTGTWARPQGPGQTSYHRQYSSEGLVVLSSTPVTSSTVSLSISIYRKSFQPSHYIRIC